MKKKISFPQLAMGLILGLLVVLGALSGVSYLYFSKLSSTPPKPDYPEISDAKKNEAKSLASVSSESVGKPDSSYVALVAFPDLILRKEPEQKSDSILTLKLDETVRVLGLSPNEQWEEVILETTGDRGWVARGNTKRVN